MLKALIIGERKYFQENICILVKFAQRHNINLDWIKTQYHKYWNQILKYY